MERYGKIHALNLEACRQALADPIEVDRPIDLYLQRLEDAIQFSQDGKTLFTPEKIVQTAYHAVNKTGLYLQYTMYPSTARGSSLAANDRTMDVRLTPDRLSTS